MSERGAFSLHINIGDYDHSSMAEQPTAAPKSFVTGLFGPIFGSGNLPLSSGCYWSAVTKGS